MQTKTPRLQRTLAQADEIANELGHPYTGTEHVLLALCSRGNGPAGRVLRAMGVTENKVRHALGAKQSSYGVDGTHMRDSRSVGNSNALEERGTPPNKQRKVAAKARSTRARSTTSCKD